LEISFKKNSGLPFLQKKNKKTRERERRMSAGDGKRVAGLHFINHEAKTELHITYFDDTTDFGLDKPEKKTPINGYSLWRLAPRFG
jgi:hypothetical protein